MDLRVEKAIRADMSLRRKLSIAAWDPPREPNIYGKLTVDVTEAQKYIEHVRETTGEKLTITHLVGKAVGMALAETPRLNGRIVFRRFQPFDTVDIAYLVALEGGDDLAKVKVENVDEKPPARLAAELNEGAQKLREGRDEGFNRGKAPLKWMPRWLLPKFLTFVGWLTSGVGVDLSSIGLEPFPFGSCVVTSVGMLGLDEGYVPPTPFARVPLYVLVGAIQSQPTAVDDEVVIRDQVTITATIDHRFVDGAHIGRLADVFRDVLENPWQLQNPQIEETSESPAGD